jgi:hypothetical protein
MKLKTIFVGVLGFWSSMALYSQNGELLFSPKGIAEIHITLADGKQIGDIKNEKANADYAGKVKATMTMTNSASSTYESNNFYTGKILIDGRGNTSWHRDKRPYNIDLVADDWAAENPFTLLGMGKSDGWCLLSLWADRSFMRFQLASYLGRRMENITWMPDNRYVEVWINNDYRGIYALSEKIQRGNDQIDIKKLDAASTDLSGGYILEASPENGEKSTPIETATQIKTNREGINFVFKYPKPKNVTEPQRVWIKNYLDEFEDALRGNNYTDPVNGYLKYINEDSFIDWTILHELSKGCDNLFHASVFVQKDRNGKLNMSAPWDFDLSFGNSGIYTEDGNWIRSHRWFSRLYQDVRYAQKFNDRYDELLPLFAQIPEILQLNYNQLEDAGAWARDHAKFPNLLNEYRNEDGNRSAPTTHKGHMQYLSEWTMSRNNWVFISLGLNNQEKGNRMRTVKPVIRIMSPEDKIAGISFDVKVMKSNDNNNQYTYSWNDSPSFTATSTRRISQIGKYWVKIKDEWGNISLTSDTLYYGVEVPQTGIVINDTFADKDVVTYNNPVKESLNINYLTTKNSNLSVLIYPVGGNRLIEKTVRLVPGNNPVRISTSGLASGVYIMRLNSDFGSISKKFVVK